MAFHRTDDEDERRLVRRYLTSRRPDYAQVDEEDQLARILATINQLRQQLNAKNAELRGLLNFYPNLKEKWDRFLNRGGVSAEDWERYSTGGDMRPRLTPRKGHLRLVSNTRPRLAHRSHIRRPSDEPDDAA